MMVNGKLNGQGEDGVVMLAGVIGIGHLNYVIDILYFYIRIKLNLESADIPEHSKTVFYFTPG